ncbi:MAG: hypothetical protein CM15mP83_6580 [Flavobacteriaceae bacterium]|nr:MAG: hypothetical protein CM15mP83_6580 [Flavobacteriaceae bacterium]
MYYALFQNVIAINVFNNEAHIYAHCYQTNSNLDEVVEVLQSPNPVTHSFSRKGDPYSNLTDDEFVDLVKKGFITAIEVMFFKLSSLDAFLNPLQAMTSPCIVY